MMQVEGKSITLPRSLWVQHGGVEVVERGQQVQLTGRDDESYIKVLNHFGRVLKLFTFEGGRWVDADTGLEAQAFDESQAGHLPAGAPAAKSATSATAKPPRKKAARPAAKPAAKSATRKAPLKKTAKTTAQTTAKKPATGKSAAGKGAARSGAARKPAARKPAGKRP